MERTMPKHEPASEISPLNGIGASANTIDQVRELLFGAEKRSTEQGLADLDNKLDALRMHVDKRFAELEASLKASYEASDSDRRKSIEAIGDAIANLGQTVRKLAV